MCREMALPAMLTLWSYLVAGTFTPDFRVVLAGAGGVEPAIRTGLEPVCLAAG
jgi:hypothetical protein